MKLILSMTVLLFSVIFPSTSSAKWVNVGTNVNGTRFYVDFQRVRKHEGYVYYWSIIDYLKHQAGGEISGVIYKQGDCNLFRYKFLSDRYYDQPMGRGVVTGGSDIPDKEWTYAAPDTMDEIMMKKICDQ